MRLFRSVVMGVAVVLGLGLTSAEAVDLSEIRIDWATYNPVGLLLKKEGFLEKEFAKDNISIRWMQSAGSNKALEFLNAGSIDFGSTAGTAALIARVNDKRSLPIWVRRSAKL